MTRYWKFLRAGGRSPFTGFEWSRLDGRWCTAASARPCADGVHACRLEDLAFWMSDELWSIELADDVRAAENKVVATAGRLGERVVRWNADRQRELAWACVARIAGHLADELAEYEVHDIAAGLQAAGRDQLPELAAAVLADPRLDDAGQSAALGGLLVDGVESVEVYPVASVAYIAARAANRRSSSSDDDPYAAERRWQNDWLRRELELDG